MFELRPHQKQVIVDIRKHWKQDRTHLVYANVGFGKTAIAAYIIKSMSDKGMKVLFVAPYTTLVEQTAQRFMEYGLKQPGIIWQNHEWTDPTNLVQIASADTLIRRDFPDDIDLLIVDECHIRRKRLLEIIDESDFPVIGLSGTPFTKWLGTYYDNLVKVTTMREMIDQGYLSDYEFFAPTTPNLEKVKTSNLAAFGNDYVESEIAKIMGDSKIVGDICRTWCEKAESRPTIAFCCNVAHANHLTVEFQKLGVQAEVMVAETPKEDRRQIIKRFEAGITKIICNVGVLVAGFDSDVRCIIYARPTKSEIRWVQCLGRGLRPAPGKDKLLVLDHSGTVHRLGFPDNIEYDHLRHDSDGLEEADKRDPDAEKKEKLPKQCPSCDYMKPAGVYVCPCCGFKPLVGEDIEGDKSVELESIAGQKKVYTKEDKQRFYSELKYFQKEKAEMGKQYSDGWIAHTYKKKFGVWPKGMSSEIIYTSESTRSFIKSQLIRYAKGRAKSTA